MTVAVLIASLLAIWGASLYWRWTVVRTQAPEIFAAKREAGELAPHVSAEQFAAAFAHHEGPRAESHIFGAGLIVGLGLAPFVWAFNAIWRILWRQVGAPPVYEVGTLLHTFLVFLAILTFIVATGFVIMRRYYRAPSGNLRRAIEQLNKAM